MAELSWFPYDVETWERRVRQLALTLEGEGILIRLVRRTWMEDRPCTIRDDPDEFARLLGAQWKKALPVVRQHFTPLAGEPHLLRCEWLYEDWLRALRKHESYQTRGRLGGRPKKNDGEQIEADLKPGHKAQPKAQPEAQVKAGLSQSSTEENSSPPSEERAILSAAVRSSPPGATPVAALLSAALALREPPPPPTLSAQHVALEEHQQTYAATLRDAVNDWSDLHGAEATEIETACAVDMGYLTIDHVPTMRLTHHRMLVEIAVAKRAKFPSERTWDGQPFGPEVPA